jgi:regulator of RNase E activity RraA
MSERQYLEVMITEWSKAAAELRGLAETIEDFQVRARQRIETIDHIAAGKVVVLDALPKKCEECRCGEFELYHRSLTPDRDIWRCSMCHKWYEVPGL